MGPGRTRGRHSAPPALPLPQEHPLHATDDLSSQTVQRNAAGQVELKLKTPWRDGTTHVEMSPLEFMQRLVALVQRSHLAPDRLFFAVEGQLCGTESRDLLFRCGSN